MRFRHQYHPHHHTDFWFSGFWVSVESHHLHHHRGFFLIIILIMIIDYQAFYRLPREQRKAAKHAAKVCRRDIFQYGRRWLFFRGVARQCLALLRALAFLSVAFEMFTYTYWCLRCVYQIFLFFQIACVLLFSAAVFFCHIFLCCLLLQCPQVQAL